MTALHTPQSRSIDVTDWNSPADAWRPWTTWSSSRRRMLGWTWWIGCAAFSVIAVRWTWLADAHWLAWAGALMTASALWAIAFSRARSWNWRVWTIAWVVGGGAMLWGVGHAAWAIGLWAAWAVVALSAGARGRWPGWWMAAGTCALLVANWTAWTDSPNSTRVGAASAAARHEFGIADPIVRDRHGAFPQSVRPVLQTHEDDPSRRTYATSGGRGW